MTDFVLTDSLLRSALRPGPVGADLSEVAAEVSARTRVTPQRSRRISLPWLPSPAATIQELQRARVARFASIALLLAAAAGVIAAGSMLLPPPAAPPQYLLLRNGQAFSMPIQGGDRRTLRAFANLGISDINVSWDGTRLATMRRARGDVLEVWDAAAVFADRRPTPRSYVMPSGVRMYHAGFWRRDGSGMLLHGSERGASRIFLLDFASGDVSRISPDGVSVDDFQPSPDDRWIEFIGQRDGQFGLYLLEIETREVQGVLLSDASTVPGGGALGWSPDSAWMAVHLERNIIDRGTWVLRPDGSGRYRITPEDQEPWGVDWSPDGAWILYHAQSLDQSCANFSVSSERRHDTWLVRADGTDGREIAPFAFPISWAEDSRSVLVESQIARPDAPLGGVLRVFIDGAPSELVYSYTQEDRSQSEFCHRYGVTTKSYRGSRR